jgi:hypothetical protein
MRGRACIFGAVLFVFMRSNPFELSDLGNRAEFEYGRLPDLYSGEAPSLFKDQLVIPPFRFYWLASR